VTDKSPATYTRHDAPSATLTPEALASILSGLPRVTLADLPTPLHDCPRLSAAVGGPRLLIKRDDMTGLALGGNKTRKLEYLLAEALNEGADTVVTSAAMQSNMCRQTAAACAKLGLDVHLVLQSSVHDEVQGNLLLDHLLGAKITTVREGAAVGAYDMSAVHAEVDRLVERLRREGRRPYVVSMQNHSLDLAGVGYVTAMLELETQFAAQNVRPTHLLLTSGSGGTHASLALAVKALGLPYRVVGISIRKTREEAAPGVAAAANRVAARLGLSVRLVADEVEVYDEFFGGGYGLPTAAGLDAIRLVARTEGILLDPVYTGKAMSGLIGLTQRGVFSKADTVVFVHTGGIPALFAYHQELAAAGNDARVD